MASKTFLSKLFLSFYRSLRSNWPLLSLHRSSTKDHHRQQQQQLKPQLSYSIGGKSLMVVDVEGGLLRSSSTFCYFMLVALEAGSIPRGLLLLLLYPLLCCLTREAAIQVMALVSFVGIKEDKFRAGRAVLPKFFLEEMRSEWSEVLDEAKLKVMCVSQMPRVMIEGFLKEYLEVETVVARELKVFAGYYTGFMEEEEGAGYQDGVSLSEKMIMAAPHHLLSQCKLVRGAEKRKWRPVPPPRVAAAAFPNPLVFHDGRMAFLPTPAATLAMFLWLPFALPLLLLRFLIFLCLPYCISVPLGAATGMINRLGRPPSAGSSGGGRLYVCNHRTLLDPIYVSGTLNRAVVAVTYSVSPVSEALSPIKTARLARDKEEDRRRMGRILGRGDDLVVCPEGTTCREPYLLRFSPLFAELAEEVVPVALEAWVTMFYGTTASGFKCLDPFYFLANPWPQYEVEFLPAVATGAMVREGRSSCEVANLVQGQIGAALGFRCTALTRKDKYMMLAGNEGVAVQQQKNKLQRS
ncbi:probable glycerol-3-phosphate acyltransferase 3 isoform X2 [Zingiber officinale]|uniref:probable glycerol-3-phosphate acyltransferase 3 isoform X2 n=1 Tax=Zingiber officinale TaxID=94328 RepID=UPI001C4C7526|nr:probable glycerol-3-phosphate acyltransferase 3 isoform X2 [Zingiber officinale]